MKFLNQIFNLNFAKLKLKIDKFGYNFNKNLEKECPTDFYAIKIWGQRLPYALCTSINTVCN